ncbi:unnamed protein product, partial [Didymodactylos carnosus]
MTTSINIADKCQALELVKYTESNQESYQIRTISVPQPKDNSNDLLVKIHSVGINPFDSMERNGYGHTLLSVTGKIDSELPRILGRDAIGTIVKIGQGKTQEKYRVGDHIWISADPLRLGTFTEYMICTHDECGLLPENYNTKDKWIELTAIPFGMTTAWTALVATGKVSTDRESGLGKKAFLHGSGGTVGLAVISILRYFKWSTIVVTCQGQNQVEELRPLVTEVIDVEEQKEFADELKCTKKGEFDFFLDGVGGAQSEDLAKTILKLNGHFVTL